MLYSRFLEYNYLTRLKLHFPLSPGTDHTILLVSLCLTILDASYQLISERNQSQKSKHFPVFENDLVAYFAMSAETAFGCSVFFVAVVQFLSHVHIFVPQWLQHATLPCPSLSPWVCSNSCALNQWCHPTISSFVAPFSSCPQSFPASGSFPVSPLFASGGQSVGA